MLGNTFTAEKGQKPPINEVPPKVDIPYFVQSVYYRFEYIHVFLNLSFLCVNAEAERGTIFLCFSKANTRLCNDSRLIF